MDTLISLRSISKTYHLGKTIVPALQQVSLDVGASELVALSGPSGSGKSTLLNTCGLIDTPDEGEYTLAGESMLSRTSKELTLVRRNKIGFVFQSFNLIPVMTAYENIEYPLMLTGMPETERKKRVNEILEQVDLTQHQHQLPDQLSGGQRQRVAMARALVKQPMLVIADEPTANLDTQTATNIIDLMKELGRRYGTTFLIATHDQRMTERCDRKIILIDGKINTNDIQLSNNAELEMRGNA